MNREALITLRYYKSLKTFSQEEEERLFCAIKDHPERVFERSLLIDSQMYWIALAVYNQYKTVKDCDLCDLMSEANVILLKLIDGSLGKYDYTIGVRFCVFAIPIILKHIGSYYKTKITLNSGVSPSSYRNAFKLSKIKEKLKDQNGYEPSLEQITRVYFSNKVYDPDDDKKLRNDIKKVLCLLSYVESTLSYDLSYESDDSDVTILNTLTDGITAESILIKEEEHKFIVTFINNLSTRDKFIICHFFQLGDCEKLSIQDMALIFGISRQAVQNIFNNIKLRFKEAYIAAFLTEPN